MFVINKMELELTDELLEKIAYYMNDRGLAYRTKIEYLNALKLIQKKYKVLNQKNSKLILGKKTQNRNKATLSLINDYCLDNEIDFNIRFTKGRIKRRRFPEIFTKEEIKIIIDSTPKPYNLMIRIIYSCGAGLRISEVIMLTYGSFSWGTWLKRTEEEPNSEIDGILKIKQGKGGKDRLVNVPYSLMKDLYDFAKEQEILDEMQYPSQSMRIFKFGYLDYENFIKKTSGFSKDKKKAEYIRTCYDWFKYNIVKKYCAKAIGRKIKIHSLRHSRATHLYEEGVPLEKIQKLLGHENIQTTLIYAQISEKETLRSMKGIKEI